MGTTHAVLIGIEAYQQQGIDSVQFAQADVAAMKEVQGNLGRLLTGIAGLHNLIVVLQIDEDRHGGAFLLLVKGVQHFIQRIQKQTLPAAERALQLQWVTMRRLDYELCKRAKDVRVE